jgi:hypothetical protein
MPPVVDANPKFRLVQPSVNFEKVISGLRKVFPDMLGEVNAYRFKCWTEAIVDRIMKDETTQNLILGVRLPVVLPQVDLSGDYGAVLETVFLPALNRAYNAEYPDRKIYDPHHDHKVRGVNLPPLPGGFASVPESRQDRLITLMKQGPVFGIYFPTAFQGFSVPMVRALINDFPEGFILSGAADIATALAAYPDVGNKNAPRLVAGANVYNTVTWHFCPGDGLGYYMHGGKAEAYSSPGLLYIDDLR